MPNLRIFPKLALVTLGIVGVLAPLRAQAEGNLLCRELTILPPNELIVDMAACCAACAAIAEFAPMPTASTNTATAVKPGLRASERAP